MADFTVVLLLVALPLTTVGLDRDAIFRQAGCEGAITIAQETSGVRTSRWIVIVRCAVVPTAEILRTPPHEEPRQVQGGCVPSPFTGWCADGRRP